MLIRCTRKVIQSFSVPCDATADHSVRQHAFEEYYVNLLRIDRRKCLLVTESRTLFSCFLPGVLKRDLVDFGDFLLRGMHSALVWAGFRDAQMAFLVQPRPYQIAPARNRRVLGSMNDLAFQAMVHIDAQGGLANINLAHVTSRLNDNPMSLIRMDSPRRVVGKLLAEQAV